MALTRRMLKELGIEDESIEKIMSEHGKVMEGMTTKAQAEEDRKKALEDFAKQWEEEHKPVKVEDSEAYKALEKKYSDLQLDINLKSAKVKDKYRDFVKSKLSTDVPFDEGIKAIKEEQALIFSGVLACLKGLQEQGCNGSVTAAIADFEEYLNKKAHT